MSQYPAIALLELSSVAVGTHAADAMVKRAPLQVLRMGTVQPGKYLILVAGDVATVEESYVEGLRIGGAMITDDIFLPDVHEQVAEAVEGGRRANDGDALGVLETSALPSMVRAADKAIKAAHISIVEIRLGDGLGGRGVSHVTGRLEDVEAAIEAGLASLPQGVASWSVVIPRQHGDTRDRVSHSTRFFAPVD